MNIKGVNVWNMFLLKIKLNGVCVTAYDDEGIENKYYRRSKKDTQSIMPIHGSLQTCLCLLVL